MQGEFGDLNIRHRQGLVMAEEGSPLTSDESNPLMGAVRRGKIK